MRYMIDRRLLRDEPDRVRWAIEAKEMPGVDIAEVRKIDARWRELKARGDELRHERNEISDRIAQLKRAGEESAAEEAIKRSQELKAELEGVEDEAEELAEELEAALLRIPNIPSADAPEGTDETDNVEVDRWGFDAAHPFPEPVRPHYELAEELGIIDFTRGAKVSSGGYQFLIGEGARLEYALIQFMLDLHRDEHGYVDVFPPLPVSARSMRGTGQFPKFVDDAYRLGGRNDEPYDDDSLWLLPTAEVPVTNMYRDEILLDDDLPIKHVAYSPNFRREAGEHGTETRGYARVHQFNKVELVNFVRPEDSDSRLQGLIEEATAVLEHLGLPHRVVEMCTGDMGFPHYQGFDIEVWAPADDMDHGPDEGGRWLEVSSASSFGAFQARRAGLRYRPERHESAEYVHTLNASGIALPRTVVAIMEYYQNDDGTVTVPEPLRPYLDGKTVITGREPVGETAVARGRRE